MPSRFISCRLRLACFLPVILANRRIFVGAALIDLIIGLVLSYFGYTT